MRGIAQYVNVSELECRDRVAEVQDATGVKLVHPTRIYIRHAVLSKVRTPVTTTSNAETKHLTD